MWIYERIHFDKTPIDIAFVGTSHTQSGIDSQLVEAALVESGGPQLHIVNLAIPHLGRDLHWIITRELIEHRQVKTLIVELQEAEARAPHPAFQRIAEVGDLLSSPLVINTGYFENLARLPLRQSLLFMHSRGTDAANEKRLFNPLTYEGPHWDDTYATHGFNLPRLTKHTQESLSPASQELQQAFEAKQTLARRLTLPHEQESLLNRYNNHYLYALLDLAKAKGVMITFLYLPFFHGPAEPVTARLLSPYGRILTPQDVLDDAANWQNEDHLNHLGAQRLSRWVAQSLADPAKR